MYTFSISKNSNTSPCVTKYIPPKSDVKKINGSFKMCYFCFWFFFPTYLLNGNDKDTKSCVT